MSSHAALHDAHSERASLPLHLCCPPHPAGLLVARPPARQARPCCPLLRRPAPKTPRAPKGPTPAPFRAPNPPQAYSSNLVDFHLVLDHIPSLAATYLAGRLPATLSYGQARALGGVCLHACVRAWALQARGPRRPRAHEGHRAGGMSCGPACAPHPTSHGHVWHLACTSKPRPFFPTRTHSHSPQAAILLTLGLQRRELSEVEAALGLPSNQVRAPQTPEGAQAWLGTSCVACLGCARHRAPSPAPRVLRLLGCRQPNAQPQKKSSKP